MRVHTFNYDSNIRTVYCGCGLWWRTYTKDRAGGIDYLFMEPKNHWEQHFQQTLGPPLQVGYHPPAPQPGNICFDCKQVYPEGTNHLCDSTQTTTT